MGDRAQRMTSPKVWFITGTSRGFGMVWARAALARGDQVVATARSTDSLQELAASYGENALLLPLDVTDRAAVDETVKQARAKFGRLDVVVNHASFGLFGAVEEVTEAQARLQIETNLFGPLWVTQAVLPYLRAQKSGHIIQVSSIGGIVSSPILGLYHASKWALEAMSEALATEVRDLGIKVTLIEPAIYSPEWAASAVHAAPMTVYDGAREVAALARSGRPPAGDPSATVSTLLKIVDSPDPPLRVLLGSGLDVARETYADRIKAWEAWASPARGGRRSR
jgi:NAD(P)-dependent dehydrogenase (short-subunit alcohol dehydrogenase family)